MDQQKQTEQVPDRSDLAELYPRVTERGGMRHDIPAYRNPFKSIADEVLVFPYHLLSLVGLGLLYAAPVALLCFIMSFGEPGPAIIFLVLLAGAVSFMSMRTVHSMVKESLEKLEYFAGGFFKAYWLSFVPIAAGTTVALNNWLHATYVGALGGAAAGILLFLVIGFILARVKTGRYIALMVLVGVSWVVVFPVALKMWLF